MSRALLVVAVLALASSLALPARAGELDPTGVAWASGVHLGITLVETGLGVGAGAALFRHASLVGDPEAAAAARTAGGLQMGVAVIEGMRAGLAVELLVTASTTEVTPTKWRATAAIASGSLHLLGSGFALASTISSGLGAEAFGERICYGRYGCFGDGANDLGGVLLAQLVFVVASVPYSLIEIGIGASTAKKARPDPYAVVDVSFSVTPTGLALSGRF
jgi:hypothetical protein